MMKNFFRILGPLLIISGLIMTIIGLVSFFNASGNATSPEYFYLALIGMPLMGIGAGISKFAFLKPIVNYLEEETRESVKNVSSSISEGWNNTNSAVIKCTKCDTENSSAANFCDNCGHPTTA